MCAEPNPFAGLAGSGRQTRIFFALKKFLDAANFAVPCHLRLLSRVYKNNAEEIGFGKHQRADFTFFVFAFN
jgi:hypothetical protein